MKNKLEVLDIVIMIVMIIASVLCILPFLLMLSVSITDERTIQLLGYSIIPSKVSFDAYLMIFEGTSVIVKSYILTIFITLLGTVIAVLITCCAAFSLSNKKIKYKNMWAFYFYLTMLFNGGLVPWYIINKNLGIYDNIFALIIPNLLFSVYNLFLVRNFMNALPYELRESAEMDGANELLIAFKIILPICAPVIATIFLFYSIAYWNDWWNAVMLVNKRELYPLQFLLYTIQSNINMVSELKTAQVSNSVLPKESMKMATAIVTIGPIILAYPFLQKYFLKGITIGAIKG